MLKQCSLCKMLPTPQCNLQGSAQWHFQNTSRQSTQGVLLPGRGFCGLLCRDLVYNLSSLSYGVYSLSWGQKPFPSSMLLNPPSRKTPPFGASISLLGLIHFTSFSEGKWGLCKHCEWGEFPREEGTTTPDQRGLLEHKSPKRTFTFYGPHCLLLSPPWILNYLASRPTHPSSIHGPQGTVSCLHRCHWPPRSWG